MQAKSNEICAMSSFSSTKTTTNFLMRKMRKVEKAKNLVEAEIGLKLMTSYGMISQRAEQLLRYCLTRYPKEPGPAIEAFVDGFIDNL